jgi:hypothetical protein
LVGIREVFPLSMDETINADIAAMTPLSRFFLSRDSIAVTTKLYSAKYTAKPRNIKRT